MAKSATVETSVRWLIRSDLPAVVAIEAQSFPSPWGEEDFIKTMRNRNCIGMVAEQGETLVGYMLYELHKNRLHILNLAVAPEARKQGVAKTLIDRLVGKLNHERRNRIMLEICETNLNAQLAFKQMGFRAVSVLREFYEGSDQDAYLMQYRIAPPNAVGQSVLDRGALSSRS
jgi:[ribosomal protein S18]-alanine N-acetyltransferase